MSDRRYPTRDDIEQANDRSYEDVPAPELGEGFWVRVQTMTAEDRDSWERLYTEAEATGQGALDGSHLLVRCLVDPQTGKRLYQDDETSLLGRKGHHWQVRAQRVAIRLNQVTKDSVEQIAKN